MTEMEVRSYNPPLSLDQPSCFSSIISVSMHSSSNYEPCESACAVKDITSFLQGYDPNALAAPNCWLNDGPDYWLNDSPDCWVNNIWHYEAGDVATWTSKQCMDWAKQVCTEKSIDTSTPELTAFTTVTGQELVNYTESHFCSLIGCYLGPIFFHKLRAQLNQQDLSPRSQHYDWSESVEEECEAPHHYYQLAPSEESSTLDSWMESKESFCDSTEPSPPYHCHDSNPAASPSSSTCSSLSNSFQHTRIKEEREWEGEAMREESEGICSASSSSLNPNPLRKIKAKGRNREREPKNWEYLARLLSSNNYNPCWIKWEDKEEGTFRLMEKDAIARLWGSRRSDLENTRTVKKENLDETTAGSRTQYTSEEENTIKAYASRGCCQKNRRRRRRSQEEDLSYDNFARGLRYHYKKGPLKAVSERQLVYQWGPEALVFLEKETNLSKQGCY